MTFTESIKSVFSKYATFSGRASRSEFWWYTLAIVIVSEILRWLSSGISVMSYNPLSFTNTTVQPWSTISSIFQVLIIVPTIAVSVRRLHDINRGGGWIAITFILLIGWIWFLILMALPGQIGPNRFGQQPE